MTEEEQTFAERSSASEGAGQTDEREAPAGPETIVERLIGEPRVARLNGRNQVVGPEEGAWERAARSMTR